MHRPRCSPRKSLSRKAASTSTTVSVVPSPIIRIRFRRLPSLAAGWASRVRSSFTTTRGWAFFHRAWACRKNIDTAPDRAMFPRFGATGYTNLGGDDHRYSAFMSYTASASVTKINGGHTWKAGFEGRLIRVNVWEARSAGNFLFSAGATQGPNPNAASATAGNSIASELLGMGTTGNVLIQGWKNVASQSYYLAPYFQDDWRVSRK